MDAPDEDATYGLTELAARSGVTARTIRFYQSVDVLPKPDRRGRAAVYHQKHLERLRLIAELRDRGLTLSAIGHLLGRRATPGMSVGDWLGLDETLRGPWSEDGPGSSATTSSGTSSGPGLPGCEADSSGPAISSASPRDRG